MDVHGQEMASLEGPKARIDDVWKQLDKVCDPELDEPITDMGFVEAVKIEDAGTIKGSGRVSVRFRLPTYWCSANFAYLMAADIRLQVLHLPWVETVHVQLEDHMFDEQVNRGVNDGLSFREIFADLAPDEDLDEIREKFRKKAFQRRQEVMLLGLQQLGIGNDRIVAMTIGEFDAVAFSDAEEARQKTRYRDILDALGFADDPECLAFRSYDGRSLKAWDVADYLSKLRSVRINMEFSGALCRGLLATRYKELGRVDGEPTLVDFMLDRVPPRENRSLTR